MSSAPSALRSLFKAFAIRSPGLFDKYLQQEQPTAAHQNMN